MSNRYVIGARAIGARHVVGNPDLTRGEKVLLWISAAASIATLAELVYRMVKGSRR